MQNYYRGLGNLRSRVDYINFLTLFCVSLQSKAVYNQVQLFLFFLDFCVLWLYTYFTVQKHSCTVFLFLGRTAAILSCIYF